MSVSRNGLQIQMRRKVSSFRPNKRRRLLPQVPVAGRSAVHKDTYFEGPSCRDDCVSDGLFSGIPLFDRPIQMIFKSRRASQAVCCATFKRLDMHDTLTLMLSVIVHRMTRSLTKTLFH